VTKQAGQCIRAPQPIGTYSQANGAAGADLDKALKLTLSVTDFAHFSQLNEIMSQYFKQPYPARSAVGVSQVPRGPLVEIEANLAKSSGNMH
jgi:enamine deaminase RidA (YjgF/YER057c/UK114 family)